MANEHIQEVGVKFTTENATEYQRTIKEINQDNAQASVEFQKTKIAMGDNATATEKLTSKAKFLSTQTDNQKEKVATLRDQLDKLTSAEEKDEKAIEAKKTELGKAEIQLEKYKKQLEETNEELGKHSEWTDKVSGKLKDVGGKLEGAGKALMPLSGAATAIGAASLAAFNEVDEGLDTIITKTGASGEALDGLNQSYNNVYGSIPSSAGDAGIAIGEVNTRFGETGETLEQLSKDFIEFATINETDLNSAIGMASKIMQQFGIDTEDTAGLLGLITSEAQRTGISVDRLMGLVQSNGATFKEMGLGVDEAVVMLANFEANGVNAETALAGLRKSFSTFSKTSVEDVEKLEAAVLKAETSESNAALAVSDARIKYNEAVKKSGASSSAAQLAANALAKAENNLSQAQAASRTAISNRDAALSESNETTQSAREKLYESVEAIRLAKDETEALALAQEAFGSKGALEMSNAIREGRFSVDDLSQSLSDYGTVVHDTFEGTLDAPDRMALAMNNLKLVGADLGNSIYSALEPMIAMVVEWAQSFATWFGGLSEGSKQAIVLILGIVAAVGPLLITLGKLSTGLGSLMGTLPQVGGAFKSLWSLISANPIIAIVGLIVATLIPAIMDLWKNNEAFRDFITGLWEKIKTVFSGFVDFVKGVFVTGWTTGFETIKGVLSSWLDSIKAIWENIKGIFTGIIDFVKNVFAGNWQGAWESIVNVFKNVFGAIGNFVKAPLNAVISLINGAISGINKISIKIPDWVPSLGGKNFGFNIPSIPMLAKGGTLLQGMAVVAEAGPELIRQQGSKTVVTPLSGASKNSALDNVSLSPETILALADAIARMLKGGDGQPVILRLMLDGRVIAEGLIDDLLAMLGKKQIDITTARG